MKVKKRLFSNIYLCLMMLCGFTFFPLQCAQTDEKQIAVDNRGAEKIVIVPDQATFLFYLSQWTPTKKFPIFIGKSKYLDKFASVYNNGDNYIEIVKQKYDGYPTKSMIYKVLIASQTNHDLNGEYHDGMSYELKEYYESNAIVPKGLVITNMKSAELSGAVALAAYHRQILEFYIPPIRPILGYSRPTKEKVRKDIIAILDKWGFSYKGIGHGIDAITIALNMPYSYGGGYSLDDAINREDKNSKDCFAYTGRLMDFGEGLALYQAMCSIFLHTSKALFFDKWPQQWGRSLDVGCWLLRDKIPCVSLRNDLSKWRVATGKINTYDLIFVNASGNPDGWSGGTVDDIPNSLPVAVYFSHSSSAAKPYDVDTIAGRFLRNGAFIYYGAISEPYATSFNKSEDVLAKWIDGASFAHCAEQKETLQDRYARPWKLIYIGDPLFFAHFDVHTKDKIFFDTFKKAQFYFSELLFGNAKDVLKNYLMQEKSLEHPAFYFKQAQQFLRKIYEFSFLEHVFGIQIYKKNLKQFQLSWIADYPNAQHVRQEMFKYEDALIQYFEKEYAQEQPYLKNNTYYKSFWFSLIMEMRRRRSYVPVWSVLGPIRINKENVDKTIQTILSSVKKQQVSIDGKILHWRIYYKNPISERLEILPKKVVDGEIWVAYFSVSAEEDNNARLRVVGDCFCRVYQDNVEIAVYNAMASPLDKTIMIKAGVHSFALVLYPTHKNPAKISLRLLDKRFLPLQKVNYIK